MNIPYHEKQRSKEDKMAGYAPTHQASYILKQEEENFIF